MAAKRKKPVEESLTSALARLLEKTILPDLAARAKLPAVAAVLAEQHAREKAASRTADTLAEWTPRWLEQIGAAWILSCVFLRTLEDRGLVRHRRLAGEGAADAEQLFFEIAPSLTARDYLLTAFREVARHPGAEELLGPGRNPAFRLSPSNEGARALLDFFRQGGNEDERGKGLRWRFEGRDTRFLGDLYQDLSASVRERYALLQTPIFVEEFILDLTLEPAIKTFGLEETHLIDPTCGSGHFLLGAFERICEHRMRTAPGVDAKVHAWAALGQVHGVDLNPYAVAIARFRLTLAYMDKAGVERLSQVPKRLPLEVVVADSLLHGATGSTGFLAGMAPAMFELEDPEAAGRVFGRKYQAVVGNPPYITCKDSALRETYRDRYVSASGLFALAAPFTERFFQLGVDGSYVGLINANSFMKREFGKKLIEDVLAHLDLTRVVDTSGAYIPGHGTPTVLLFGRNQRPTATTIHAILGRRGEPETPTEAEKGQVWSSIIAHLDQLGYEDAFLSVVEIPRSTLAKHPWSLGGGGAAELKSRLESHSAERLGKLAESIGFGCITKQDDVFCQPHDVLVRARIEVEHTRPFGIGEDIRDWSAAPGDWVIFPYSSSIELAPASAMPHAVRFMWPFREALYARKVFGGSDYRTAGRSWYEFGQIPAERFRTPLSIAFAFVATHNHFVLDRGGKVFKQSAPIIKLPESATEDDHLALLAYFNSSAACFWMKQVFYPKARSDGDVGVDKGKPEANRFEFTATGLLSLPVPIKHWHGILAHHGRELDRLAAERDALDPLKLVARWHGHVASDLEEAIHAKERAEMLVLRRMVALQDDLDWKVYEIFSLASSRASQAMSKSAVIHPEERPFAAAEAPSGLSPGDRAIWELRRQELLVSLSLTALEDVAMKRSWRGARGVFAQNARTFRESVLDGARGWLGDQVEALLQEQRGSTTSPPLAARNIASAIEQDPKSAAVLAFLRTSAGDIGIIDEILQRDAIPYLAALRHTDAGLETRAQWEHTWALQRREDAGEKLPSPIPVPEKYDAKDFRDANYFRLRGKLDVPKERFISYPGAETDDDRSPLFGWAGWDHLQRATALAGLFENRKTEHAWSPERLTPLLAGILELVPWLKQWHNEMNQDFGERLGDYYERYVDTEARALGLTLDALRAWRPEAKGRKPRGPKGAT
jgi:hypothetical protein